MAYCSYMYWAFVLNLVFLTAVQSKYESCSDSSTVTKVLCNEKDADVCILTRGTNATLEVDFTPKVSAQTVGSVCHGIIGGVRIPFDSIDKNGCDGMKPECPIQAGKHYVFKTTIPVVKLDPEVELIVQWEEQDPNSDDVFCIELPAKIQ